MFTDDFTRYTWIYFMHNKSEVFGIFKHFLAMVVNQLKNPVKILLSNLGGEYVSHYFESFLSTNSIIH